MQFAPGAHITKDSAAYPRQGQWGAKGPPQAQRGASAPPKPPAPAGQMQGKFVAQGGNPMAMGQSTMGDGSDIKSMDAGLRTQEAVQYDSMAAAIRESLQGDISHIPQAVRDGKGTEFIPANFPKHFPHDLKIEEKLGMVPPKWKTTQQLSDPRPPKELRVKSGYTGHVPHGRDYIGGSYKAHDNRGTATKDKVPVIHAQHPGQYDYRTLVDPSTYKMRSKDMFDTSEFMTDKELEYAAENAPVEIRPMPDPLLADPRMRFHDPFNKPKAGIAQGRMGDHQHEYGVPTTAPVPMRVDKVLSGDHRDMSDEENAAAMADDSTSSQLHGGQRDMGGLGTWVMAGYTGHVPKAREVYGSSYYGPPEGNSYHGPYYASDIYGQPGSPNREAICP